MRIRFIFRLGLLFLPVHCVNVLFLVPTSALINSILFGLFLNLKSTNDVNLHQYYSVYGHHGVMLTAEAQLTYRLRELKTVDPLSFTIISRTNEMKICISVSLTTATSALRICFVCNVSCHENTVTKYSIQTKMYLISDQKNLLTLS
ncbi:hypothetical protein T08_15717 [Trichinella sp. T8]|nr:hypothetical protein T08_15717 [Trichinella sp. T8]